MRHMLLAILLGLLISDAAASATMYVYNNHTYYLTPWAMTWGFASMGWAPNPEPYAPGQGYPKHGYLVTVNDQAEQDWLVATFGGTTRYWIGLNDISMEGHWGWANGEPVTYTNWNTGEPTNWPDEDVAIMNWDKPGGWNDIVDDPMRAGYRGIIEVGQANPPPPPPGPDPVPEPFSCILACLGLAVVGARRQWAKLA